MLLRYFLLLLLLFFFFFFFCQTDIFLVRFSSSSYFKTENQSNENAGRIPFDLSSSLRRRHSFPFFFCSVLPVMHLLSLESLLYLYVFFLLKQVIVFLCMCVCVLLILSIVNVSNYERSFSFLLKIKQKRNTSI